MVHWGIIGLGKIADTFATALTLVANANLRAVASRNLQTAINFKDQHNADVSYGSYKALANDPDITLVYIATPHVFHFEHSKMCLERGKAVLCEKPMGMSAQQVKTLCAIAKENNTLLMEGMWTAFLPNFNRLQHIVSQNTYGAIKNVQAEFCFAAPLDPSNRLLNKSLGGGTILDIGIYNIFACLRILGKPETIFVEPEISDTGIDIESDIKFIYKNSTANLTSSFKKDASNSLQITFEKGEAILGPKFFSPATLKLSSNNGETIEFEKYLEGTGYELEARHFQELYLNQQLESNIMSHNHSIELATYLDLALLKAGISYKLAD